MTINEIIIQDIPDSLPLELSLKTPNLSEYDFTKFSKFIYEKCGIELKPHKINKGDTIVFASVGAGMNINSMVYKV